MLLHVLVFFTYVQVTIMDMDVFFLLHVLVFFTYVQVTIMDMDVFFSMSCTAIYWVECTHEVLHSIHENS